MNEKEIKELEKSYKMKDKRNLFYNRKPEKKDSDKNTIYNKEMDELYSKIKETEFVGGLPLYSNRVEIYKDEKMLYEIMFKKGEIETILGFIKKEK